MAQGEQWSAGGAQCEDGFLERSVAEPGAAVCEGGVGEVLAASQGVRRRREGRGWRWRGECERVNQLWQEWGGREGGRPYHCPSADGKLSDPRLSTGRPRVSPGTQPALVYTRL